ncbi:hypothetical protein DRQ07_09160 [candidate division KSB1 bacterium]|nr:MAG: hypothetical protein DRQ07_09160 [candidate division KSB1 bacterium]
MGFLNCNQITVTANPTDLDFMAFFWYIDKINLRVFDNLKQIFKSYGREKNNIQKISEISGY